MQLLTSSLPLLPVPPSQSHVFPQHRTPQHHQPLFLPKALASPAQFRYFSAAFQNYLNKQAAGHVQTDQVRILCNERSFHDAVLSGTWLQHTETIFRLTKRQQAASCEVCCWKNMWGGFLWWGCWGGGGYSDWYWSADGVKKVGMGGSCGTNGERKNGGRK